MGDVNYSIEEKVFSVIEYIKVGENATEVVRRFQKHFSTKQSPSIVSIKAWFMNFKENGTVHDLRAESSGGGKKIRTEDTVRRIKQYFQDNPTHSLRVAEGAVQIRKSTIHLVLKEDLKFKAYKITIVQPLTERAIQKRLSFANQMITMIDNQEFDPIKIFFSDECHFWLNGFVNKQN